MSKKTLVEIHHTTKNEFLKEFSNLLDEKLKNLNKQNLNKQTKLLSRKSTAKYFSVSTVTIDTWTEKGYLKSYKTGNRKFYKLNELEQALTKLNN